MKTLLEFLYEPPDFFGATKQLAIGGRSIAVDGGAATFTIADTVERLGRNEIAALTEAVRAVFQARQVINRRAFSLVTPNITHVDDDGRQDRVIVIETGRLTITGFAPTITITAPDGTLIRDTHAEQLAEEQRFVDSAADKVSESPTLRRMLDAYSRAVDDPADELVHLYEIRDAAVQHFGGDAVARNAVGVSAADWRTLGRLANAEPIAEGRHRGKQLDGIRAATEDELAHARAIARRIITGLVASL